MVRAHELHKRREPLRPSCLAGYPEHTQSSPSELPDPSSSRSPSKLHQGSLEAPPELPPSTLRPSAELPFPRKLHRDYRCDVPINGSQMSSNYTMHTLVSGRYPTSAWPCRPPQKSTTFAAHESGIFWRPRRHHSIVKTTENDQPQDRFQHNQVNLAPQDSPAQPLRARECAREVRSTAPTQQRRLLAQHRCSMSSLPAQTNAPTQLRRQHVQHHPMSPLGCWGQCSRSQASCPSLDGGQQEELLVWLQHLD